MKNNYTIRQRDQCRVCGSNAVRRFLHFDQMPLADGFVSAPNLGTEFLAPLSVHWCAECKIAQTLYDVQVNDYYREYRYTVSSSPFAQQFMRRLAENAFARFALRPGDSIIEVGSGDGYQLARFKELGARVLGYEPSADLGKLSHQNGVPVVECLFQPETFGLIPLEMRPAQVVLLTYTFDHLPDPLGFLRAVREVLDPARGLLIIEVHDLAKIAARREACLFEHEHSIYLTLLTMERLLAQAGFKLLTNDLVPEEYRRGNSLLIAAAFEDSQYTPDAIALPPSLNQFDEWQVYGNLGSVIHSGYSRLRDYVQRGITKGKRFAGYGAGGRGVVSLAMADLTQNEIAYLCDRNPSLHGFYAPRSHVPVVAPEHLRADPVDEVIVFASGYMSEIKGQLADYIEQGGKLTLFLDLV